MNTLSKNIQLFISKCETGKNEVEFRFFEMNGPRFSVSRELFHDVISGISQSSFWTKIESRNDTVIIAKPLLSGSDVRQISHGKSTIYQTKSRKSIQNFSEFNIKASEAFEDEIEISSEKWSTEYMPSMMRHRKRISFSDPSLKWRLDATEVIVSGKNIDSTIFEIELEYIASNNRVSISNISDVFENVLKMMQRSNHVMSNLVGSRLISQYSALLDMNPRYPKFVGPLPFTLTKNTFDSGKLSCGYSVTDKADGDRKLMYIGDSGITLLLSRPKDSNIQYRHVGYRPDLVNSIFDGELINDTLYLFDTLVYKGNDMRRHPLDHRLDKLASFNSSQILDIGVKIKTFFLSENGEMRKILNGKKVERIDMDIYKASAMIWKNKSTLDYKLDGLIYTPILANYYNNSIFKWKDSHTIDFFITKISSTTWKLSIGGLDSKNIYQNLPFEGLNNDGIFHLRGKGQSFDSIRNEIFFSDSNLKTGLITVSATLARKFPDLSVVEFKYYGGKFIPTRSRTDKNFANNVRAINDVWESITKPVSLSTLKAGVYKSCTRIFHNSIKRTIIHQFSKKKTVLDIGSGAGGDISKYIEAGAKQLVGIDIVDVEYNHPKHMSFFKVKDELYNIKTTVQNLKIGKFDTINCHFALHYFFKSDDTLTNFINNLKENIKPGGVFVATCMDGNRINDMLTKYKVVKGKTLTIKHNDKGIFKMKKMYKDVEDINELPITNQKIAVKLSGTKYFKDLISTEYLVNIEKFIELMKTHNFKHIQTVPFSDMEKAFSYECQSMNSGEKQFSFLNSYIVFSKD